MKKMIFLMSIALLMTVTATTAESWPVALVESWPATEPYFQAETLVWEQSEPSTIWALLPEPFIG